MILMTAQISEEEFKKSVHRDVSEWRNKKIKEIFSKENPSEMEIELVNRLIEIWGDYLWDIN